MPDLKDVVDPVKLNLSLSFRSAPVASDPSAIAELTAESGFFSSAEQAIAVELIDERLARGLASGYHFCFAECENNVVGYVCFGPIPCTVGSYDVYWIVVRPQLQGIGIGRALMTRAEVAIRQMGGRRIYIETSGRQLYRSTREFYRSLGYQKDAELADFYAPGDSKVIEVKSIERPVSR